MSGGSPGKNGDGVIVRLATLTQWAVSAMLNTVRIHIFMRVDLLCITGPHAAHTRARSAALSVILKASLYQVFSSEKLTTCDYGLSECSQNDGA